MQSTFGLAKAFLVVAVAALTLGVGISTASAATPTDKKQSKSIKKNSKSIKKNSKEIKKGAKAIKNLRSAAKATDKAIAALKLVAERADKNAAGLVALAPAILDGLTQLKTGLLAAGDGLNSLKTLATSTEYGFGQVFIGGAPAGGSFLVTPDIPDAVQQAQTSQTFVAGASGVITVRVGVRSAETDGDGETPAAHCRVTAVQGVNSTTSTANPGLGGAPFYPIPNKSRQTSTGAEDAGFPFGQVTPDDVVDLTAAGNSASPTGTPATAAAGQPYTVTLSCVDTSPSASDPSA